jgi:hypothetical protein
VFFSFLLWGRMGGRQRFASTPARRPKRRRCAGGSLFSPPQKNYLKPCLSAPPAASTRAARPWCLQGGGEGRRVLCESVRGARRTRRRGVNRGGGAAGRQHNVPTRRQSGGTPHPQPPSRRRTLPVVQQGAPAPVACLPLLAGQQKKKRKEKTHRRSWPARPPSRSRGRTMTPPSWSSRRRSSPGRPRRRRPGPGGTPGGMPTSAACFFSVCVFVRVCAIYLARAARSLTKSQPTFSPARQKKRSGPRTRRTHKPMPPKRASVAAYTDAFAPPDESEDEEKEAVAAQQQQRDRRTRKRRAGAPPPPAAGPRTPARRRAAGRARASTPVTPAPSAPPPQSPTMAGGWRHRPARTAAEGAGRTRPAVPCGRRARSHPPRRLSTRHLFTRHDARTHARRRPAWTRSCTSTRPRRRAGGRKEMKRRGVWRSETH